MAEVPRVGESRAQLAVVNAPRLDPRDPVGAALADIGSTIASTAVTASRLYARVRDEDDQRQAMEAFLGIQDDLRGDLYGDGQTAGALNAEGASALGASERLGERIAQAVQERSKGLTPGASAYFGERVASWRDGVLDTAANNEVAQTQAHNRALRAAEFNADAGLVFRAPSNLQAAFDRATARAAANRSLSPELQAEAAKEEQGKLAVMAISSLMESDAASARALLEQHRALIAPDALEELERRTKTEETEQWALGRAKELLALPPVQAWQQVLQETDPDRVNALMRTYDALSTQVQQAKDQARRDAHDNALEVYANTGRLPSWAPAELRIRVREQQQQEARAVASEQRSALAQQGKDALAIFTAETTLDPDWWDKISNDDRAQLRLAMERQPGAWAQAKSVRARAQTAQGQTDRTLFASVARPFFEAAGVRFDPGSRRTAGDAAQQDYLTAIAAWNEEMDTIRRVHGREPTANDATAAAVRLTQKVRVPSEWIGTERRFWFDLFGERDEDGRPLATQAVLDDPDDAKVQRYVPQARSNLIRQLRARGVSGAPSPSSVRDEALRLYTDTVLQRN